MERSVDLRKIMGNILPKVFKVVVKIIKELISCLSKIRLISVPLNNITKEIYINHQINSIDQKCLAKSTLKEIKNLINNQISIMEYPMRGETVTLYMDVHKAKI